MRNDMQKVVNERARVGGGKSAKKWARHMRRDREGRSDLEELPFRESMSAGRNYGWEGKESRTHSMPFKRYLEKAAKLEQRWDEIFSDICEKSCDQTHHPLVELVDWYVETQTVMHNGEVYTNYAGELYPVEGVHQTFYVHPETNLLMRTKQRVKFKSKLPKNKNLHHIRLEKTVKDGVGKWGPYFRNVIVGHEYNFVFEDAKYTRKNNGLWYKHTKIGEYQKTKVEWIKVIEIDPLGNKTDHYKRKYTNDGMADLIGLRQVDGKMQQKLNNEIANCDAATWEMKVA